VRADAQLRLVRVRASVLALSQLIWAHQSGEPGLVTPKLIDFHREPGLSTKKNSLSTPWRQNWKYPDCPAIVV
jgi:hypothetical protein